MEEVVIVGASIVGLATAVALKKVGIRMLVLERSKELRVTGVALGLHPNAWLALNALGVSDKLVPLYDPFHKIGGPPRAVHRRVLSEVLAEELPPNTIRFSSKITFIETQVEQGSSICVVTLDDGTIIKSKAVVGCDGVHSVGHGLDHGCTFQQFVDVGKRAGFVTLNDKEIYWFFLGECPLKGMENGVDPEMIQKEVSENLAKYFLPVYLDVVKRIDLSSLTWAPLMFRYPWDVLFGNLA
ncbi:hypothetical protein NL676_014078 [Syzygium grande]|nr:hypothetical protein NL676_014078 [Syzygium grande]